MCSTRERTQRESAGSKDEGRAFNLPNCVARSRDIRRVQGTLSKVEGLGLRALRCVQALGKAKKGAGLKAEGLGFRASGCTHEGQGGRRAHC